MNFSRFIPICSLHIERVESTSFFTCDNSIQQSPICNISFKIFLRVGPSMCPLLAATLFLLEEFDAAYLMFHSMCKTSIDYNGSLKMGDETSWVASLRISAAVRFFFKVHFRVSQFHISVVVLMPVPVPFPHMCSSRFQSPSFFQTLISFMLSPVSPKLLTVLGIKAGRIDR